MGIAEKLCFMFPGQGTQKVGMGMDFYDAYAEVRDLFAAANDFFGVDLPALLKNGPQSTLTDTINAQPVITVLNISLHSLLARYRVPDFVAGHSLGEVSAVYAAGCITLEQLFYIIKQRSAYMAEAAHDSNGAMIAIENIGVEKLQDLVGRSGGGVSIANDNAPSQVVLSGDKTLLSDFLRSAEDELKGTRQVPLKVSGAWHSTLMTGAAEKFGKAIGPLAFKPPSIPVLLNINGEPCTDPALIKQAMIAQLTRTVCWTKTIRNFVSLDTRRFYTAGFGKVLKGLFLSNARDRLDCRSFAIETVVDFERCIAKAS